jgi:hypothetical protein
MTAAAARRQVMRGRRQSRRRVPTPAAVDVYPDVVDASRWVATTTATSSHGTSIGERSQCAA